MQTTCDHRGIITSYDMGWPGSVQDTRVFRASALWTERGKYFQDDEYILADKGSLAHLQSMSPTADKHIGYPLTKFTIRPFADNDLTNNRLEARARRRWNFDLSHLRVRIEHSYGRLKGRFPLLRRMTGENLQVMWRTIEACLIMHNILTELGDDPTTIEGFNGLEEVDNNNEVNENMQHTLNNNDQARQNAANRMTEEDLYRTGLLRRKQLLNLVFND